MAALNYFQNLINSIGNIIYTNNMRLIEGNAHRDLLVSVVTQLGDKQLRGVAVPSTLPGVPEGPVSYLASENGTYSNFGAITITNEIALIAWNKTGWTKFKIVDIGNYLADNAVQINHLSPATIAYIESLSGGEAAPPEIFSGTLSSFNAGGAGTWDNIKLADLEGLGLFEILTLGSVTDDGKIVIDATHYTLRKRVDIEKDIIVYETISDLKGTGFNLPVGVRVLVLGGATPDGTGNIYQIVSSTETGDDYSIIEITGVSKRAKIVLNSISGGDLGY